MDKANWDQFTEITEQIAGIPDSEPLEFYGQVIGKITEGTTKSIPKSDGYYKVAPVPWWNANCANLKKEYKVYLVYRELCHLVQYTCPIILLLISGLNL